MARGLRRLRGLNIDGPRAEPVQGEHENIADNGPRAEPIQEEQENIADNGNNESLQSPPDIDGLLARLPHQPRNPIKIICPNGDVRQIIGEFTLKNLLALQGGGKVIIETDENGVPNERSASILGQHLGHLAESPTFAPLDIPRFDNRMFDSHKEQIIKDVELKFSFPRQTIHLTRDWILRTVNNRWRAYKSKLKKQYFNRDERTLEEIIREKPLTVNEHQWKSLVGIWCQEPHKKLCATNSRCAKEQKTAHTTGRKSHARLKKEMESTNKRKFHRIELWEAAHKKKNGRYTTEKVETLMAASYEELRKRKENNSGNHLSSKDYNEVFNDIVAKEFKARGYYDDKYWSQVQVSQGLPFVTQTEEERLYKEKINAMENQMECMSDFMKYLLTFMSKKYPEDNLVEEMKAFLHEEAGQSSDHDINDDDISESHVSKHTDGIHENSDADVNSCTNELRNMVQAKQQQQSVHRIPRQIEGDTSTTREQRTSKETQLETQLGGNVVRNLSCDPILHNMKARRVKASNMSVPKSREEEVYLFSLINKNKVVAKGKLVTTNSQREISGRKLGSEYCGVYVEGLENIDRGNKGDEEVPRPFEKIRTLIDAIGYVIAWPTTHVKHAKSSSRTRNKVVPAARRAS